MSEIVEPCEECEECKAGAPLWMATFADLMSLLMCFFVLLLSFSEMDVSKYKQLAGSMRDAFGVQNKINVQDIPKGTSVIALEFSPGKPEPTPINEVRQQTIEDTKNTLDVRIEDTGNEVAGEGVSRDVSNGAIFTDDASEQDIKALLVKKLKILVKETESDAGKLALKLKKEISSGKVDIETKGRRIIIRVREQGSFLSGSAQLRPSFIPAMKAVRDELKNINGQIAVEGHTDSVPISTQRFKSNWDLSSARALSVAYALLEGGKLDQNRFMVTGYADTRPIAANDKEEARAKNRRVEIVIDQGFGSDISDDFKKLRQIPHGVLRELNLDTTFVLSPDEIF